MTAPPVAPMTPIDRRVAMLRAGISQSEIARALGLSHVTVHKVCAGKSALYHESGPRVAREVARRLKLPLAIVFPELVGQAKDPAA